MDHRISHRRVMLGALAAAAAACGAPAHADSSLPAAIFHMSVQGGAPVDGPGTLTYPGIGNGSIRISQATTSSTPQISLYANAFDGGYTVSDEVAAATIEYYFSVSGPGGGGPVPVTLTYRMGFGAGPQAFNFYSPDDYYHTGYYAATSLSIDGSGDASDYHFRRQDVGGVPCVYSSLVGPTCGFGPTSEDVSDSLSILAAPNAIYRIVMHGEIGDPDWGEVHAFIDPFIQIDTAYAADYTLLLSDGVGNSPPSAVPEPSTWLVLVIGLAGVGLAARRRGLPTPRNSPGRS